VSLATLKVAMAELKHSKENRIEGLRFKTNVFSTFWLIFPSYIKFSEQTRQKSIQTNNHFQNKSALLY
jgi:hypothetical protein